MPAGHTSQPTPTALTNTADPDSKPNGEAISRITEEKHKKPPSPENTGRLGTVGAGFTATASLDPDALKVSGGKQLNYDKFIEQIGGRYTGTQSNNTFKIYKKDDTTQQNTLMEQRADGSLVFRKEFSEEDAKLFLESIESLAETSTTEGKLQLQMANFTPAQLDCIRTLVAQPDARGATPYKELLSRVTFLSADGEEVDLSQKPPQASPQLVAKPKDAADLPPPRPKSAP